MWYRTANSSIHQIIMDGMQLPLPPPNAADGMKPQSQPPPPLAPPQWPPQPPPAPPKPGTQPLPSPLKIHPTLLKSAAAGIAPQPLPQPQPPYPYPPLPISPKLSTWNARWQSAMPHGPSQPSTLSYRVRGIRY